MKALTLFISHSIKAKGIHVFTEPTNVKKVRNTNLTVEAISHYVMSTFWCCVRSQNRTLQPVSF